MSDNTLTLSVLAESLAICRLPAHSAIPAWALIGPLFSVTRTADELSLVCPETLVPDGILAERGWRALKVEGPLDFALTGILAGLAGALADAGISLFAISTYDTDYILVRAPQFPAACQALQDAGYRLQS